MQIPNRCRICIEHTTLRTVSAGVKPLAPKKLNKSIAQPDMQMAFMIYKSIQRKELLLVFKIEPLVGLIVGRHTSLIADAYNEGHR